MKAKKTKKLSKKAKKKPLKKQPKVQELTFPKVDLKDILFTINNNDLLNLLVFRFEARAKNNIYLIDTYKWLEPLSKAEAKRKKKLTANLDKLMGILKNLKDSISTNKKTMDLWGVWDQFEKMEAAA